MRPHPYEPSDLGTHGLPDVLYVTTRDGQRFVLREPVVVDDSLIGRRFEREGRWRRSGPDVAVPLESIERLEREQLDGIRTVVLVAGIAGSLVLFYIIGMGSHPERS